MVGVIGDLAASCVLQVTDFAVVSVVQQGQLKERCIAVAVR